MMKQRFVSNSIRVLRLSKNSPISAATALYRPRISMKESLSSPLALREFHTTSTLFAPKNKKDKKDRDSDESSAELPDIKAIETNMNSRIQRMETEFQAIRGAKASADMFNNLRFAAFGSTVTLSSAAQVTLQTPTRLSVVVYDNTLVKDVAEAIGSSGMNLTPSIEGSTITVNIPKTTKETKDLLVKQASKVSEKTKLEVRQIRKDALDIVKKMKSSVSEDSTRKFSKDIDVITEKLIDKITKKMKDKESEIMAV